MRVNPQLQPWVGQADKNQGMMPSVMARSGQRMQESERADGHPRQKDEPCSLLRKGRIRMPCSLLRKGRMRMPCSLLHKGRMRMPCGAQPLPVAAAQQRSPSPPCGPPSACRSQPLRPPRQRGHPHAAKDSLVLALSLFPPLCCSKRLFLTGAAAKGYF